MILRKLVLRMKARIYGFLDNRDWLRGEFIHRLLGDRIFKHEIWHISERSLSGGLAIGLFVAFAPTISIQMLICALLAIWFRVNLPMALAACWVTNPVTAVPIYTFAFKLGRWLVGCLPDYLKIHGFGGQMAIYFTNSFYLVVGGVTMGFAAAFGGYLLVKLAWRLVGMVPDRGGETK